MKKNRKYDKKFKLDAVKLALKEGNTTRGVAQDLGIPGSTLRYWIGKYEEDPDNCFPGKGHLKPEDAEMRRLKKKLADVTEERNIFIVPIQVKKSHGCLFTGREMKYKFIEENCSTFHVEKMAKVLRVSRSSYYSWKKRGKGKRRKENEILLGHIKNIYQEHKGNYGSPRITEELKDMGIKCGHNRVARLMKKNGIVAKTKKKYKTTTKSKHDKPVAPDLLNKDFTAAEKDQVWTSDITYIWTKEGWLYLAVILDIFSRKIVGWTLEKYLKKELVTEALEIALAKREPGKGLIFHSDRGVQYASKEVIRILNDNEMLQSMSEKGNCYGNAITESFFHTFIVRYS